MAQKNETLPTLIELAQTRADEAAKALQQITSERNKAQKQLDTLHEYRLDYARRLQEATQSGLSAGSYQNYRQFIATLDTAIVEQGKLITQFDQKIETGRKNWYAEKRRLNSYEALQSRQDMKLAAQQARKDQIASDEISASLYRRLRQQH
ncbi:MAG: flagellar export protein FliJ [Alcaligenaceae bacterium]|nr:flagellar export protein FliJ [Alcaligenaceae bacterium]